MEPKPTRTDVENWLDLFSVGLSPVNHEQGTRVILGYISNLEYELARAQGQPSLHGLEETI